MRTSHFFLLPALVAILTLAGGVSAADPIGFVVAVQGYATATGTDGQERRLQLKSEILLDDRLITGRAARLQVLFDDDAVITQGENSEMVVDKYIYSPKEKKHASCAMKFASGLFRVVTGKIAAINPERFKVQTRMASIGIRGCEVGFLLDEEREDVYILWLPAGKSILVERTPGTAGPSQLDLPASNDMLDIVQAGTAVSIAEGARLRERVLSAAELTEFYRNLLMDFSAPPSGQSASGQGSAANRLPGASEITSLTAVQNEASLKPLAVVSAAITPKLQTTGGNQPATRPDSLPSLLNVPTTGTEPTGGPSGGGPDTPPPANPNPDQPLPPTPAALAAGNGWQWVIYSDGSMENVYTPGFQLSDADFQLIKAGGTTLTGSGQASAFITHSAGNQLVNGTCDLTVQMGASPDPTWNGSFDMRNGGDSLYFESGGTIVTGGQLTKNKLNNYALTVNGSSHNASTLTAQQLVESFLVGPQGPPPSASGAHGHFFFAHGPSANPKADVAFGTNLQ